VSTILQTQYSKIYMHKRKIIPGYWTRNKDNLTSQIIIGIILGLFGLVAGLIIKK
jgi:site-specific recombinase